VNPAGRGDKLRTAMPGARRLVLTYHQYAPLRPASPFALCLPSRRAPSRRHLFFGVFTKFAPL